MCFLPPCTSPSRRCGTQWARCPRRGLRGATARAARPPARSGGEVPLRRGDSRELKSQTAQMVLSSKLEVPCRWPVAGVGPLPVGPMPQNAQNSVIATWLEMSGFLSSPAETPESGACEAQVTDGSSAPNSAMAVSSSGRNGHCHRL